MTKKCLLLLSMCFLLTSAQSKLDHEIHELMEEMDLPETGAKMLVRQGRTDSKDFATAVKEILVASEKVAKLKHPDKKFRDYAADTVRELKALEKMIAEKKEAAAIKAQWRKVDRSCKACHKDYEDH